MADSNLTTTINSVAIGSGGVYGLMNYIGAFHIGGGLLRYTLNQGYFANNIFNNYSGGKKGRYGYGDASDKDAEKGYVDSTTGKVFKPNGATADEKLADEQRRGDRIGDYYTTKGLPRVSTKEFMDTKTFSLLGAALRDEQRKGFTKEFPSGRYKDVDDINYKTVNFIEDSRNFGDTIKDISDAKEQKHTSGVKANDKTKKQQEALVKANKYKPFGEDSYHLPGEDKRTEGNGLDIIDINIGQSGKTKTPEGFKNADDKDYKFPEKDWSISGVADTVRNFYKKYTNYIPENTDERPLIYQNLSGEQVINALKFGEKITDIVPDIDSLFKDGTASKFFGGRKDVKSHYEENAASSVEKNKFYQYGPNYSKGYNPIQYSEATTWDEKTETNKIKEYYTVSDDLNGNSIRIDRNGNAAIESIPDFATALLTYRYGINYAYYEEYDSVKSKIPAQEEKSAENTSLSFNGTIININSANTKSPIVNKVNRYFRNGKIHSLINRFHTESVGEAVDGDFVSAKDPKYGLSRGRNLLKKNPEQNNGWYDNPYCRVWTAHKQYSTMKDRIRPFMDGDDFLPLSEIQKRLYGTNWTRPNIEKFEHSVLQDNGFVKITPHWENTDSGPQLVKENLKNYMFSIENLAWKDYADERFLSKEQIGPNGGRIMWFPPYNLKFNENVNTTWKDNDFIGRGEKIYTYVNTERAGTLNFTLLIDHPSAINKWNKDSTDKEELEQRLLRFFAGCELLDPSEDKEPTIRNKGKKRNEETPKPEVQKVEPPVEPQEEKFKPVPFSFIMFFPNNFSGVDYKGEFKDLVEELDLYETSKDGSTVEIIDNSFSGDVYNVSANYINENIYGLNTKSGLDENIELVQQLIKEAEEIVNNGGQLYSYEEFKKFAKMMFPDGNNQRLFGTLDLSEYEIKSMVPRGYASSDGDVKKNDKLFRNRSNTVKDLAKYFLKGAIDESIFEEDTRGFGEGIIQLEEGDNATIRKELGLGAYQRIPENRTPKINRLMAKIARCGIITVNVVLKEDIKTSPTAENFQAEAAPSEDEWQGDIEPIEESRLVDTDGWRKYEYVEYSAQGDYTYQNEYLYFKQITKENNIVYKNIVDKIQFFDPAFHSLTPEGFNARLNFLHQCTRQGPTVGTHSGGDAEQEKKDAVFKMAGNLAFGKAPYCVLRIGDFFNSKIVITSVQIDYDTGSGIQWDLNPEGAGVQPMMANVSLSFNFIGGQDMTGPVAELQNAVSFNYYANSSLYESRNRITE